MLKQGDGPVFEIHGHRELVAQGQALQLFRIFRAKRYRFFQHHVFAGFKGLPGQGKAWSRWRGDHHGVDRWIVQEGCEIAVARQLSFAAGSLEPLLAGMPEGNGFARGAGPKGWQVNLFAEAKASDSHP